MYYLESQNELKRKKKIVNKAVRICVSCGSLAVSIENYGIFCKDCGSSFAVEEKK